jgi:hypothetical protein
MTNDQLYAALVARLGAQFRYILPGEAYHVHEVDGRAGLMAILDDRCPGSNGPSSFDGHAFRNVLGGIRLIFLDYSPNPDFQWYELLANGIGLRFTVLVIQTSTDRDEVWFAYLVAHYRGDSLAMIAPTKGPGRWMVRRMDELAPASGLTP